MPPTFSPITGAQGFQQSNPSVFALASLLGSLETLKEAGMMDPVRERSLQLTGALEKLLVGSRYFVPASDVWQKYGRGGSTAPGFTVITPIESSSRGAQLSLVLLPTGSGIMQKVFNSLVSYGVIGDERQPDVIRLAPVPLYNTLIDCENAAKYLGRALDSL
jgi:kynureninase